MYRLSFFSLQGQCLDLGPDAVPFRFLERMDKMMITVMKLGNTLSSKRSTSGSFTHRKATRSTCFSTYSGISTSSSRSGSWSKSGATSTATINGVMPNVEDFWNNYWK